MKYKDFETIVSEKRMRKYLAACNQDRRRAMLLYRLNFRLSQEIFTVISCFEVALRNAIDRQMTARWGEDWLRDFSQPGGIFYQDERAGRTHKKIDKAYRELLQDGLYSHSKLLCEMGFGFWKFMFSNLQFRLSGRVILRAFPDKPRSTPAQNLGNLFIFAELDYINNLRNRIAHHEPIVFDAAGQINTFYVRSRYEKMLRLFLWMGIDSRSMLYGLDHVRQVCDRIHRLQTIQINKNVKK